MNYLFLVLLPNINNFFCTMGCISMGLSVIFLIICACKKIESCDEDDEKKCLELSKNISKLFFISLLIFFISCFIPDKKDIIQLKVISIISELKGIDNIPQKIIEKLNDLLECKENDNKK